MTSIRRQGPSLQDMIGQISMGGGSPQAPGAPVGVAPDASVRNWTPPPMPATPFMPQAQVGPQAINLGMPTPKPVAPTPPANGPYGGGKVPGTPQNYFNAPGLSTGAPRPPAAAPPNSYARPGSAWAPGLAAGAPPPPPPATGQGGPLQDLGLPGGLGAVLGGTLGGSYPPLMPPQKAMPAKMPQLAQILQQFRQQEQPQSSGPGQSYQGTLKAMYG